MGHRWYLVSARGEQGPIDSAQLKHLATAGRISAQTMIRRESDTAPFPAGRVKGLFPESSAQPPSKTGDVRLEFFVVAADREHGPFTVAQLKELAAEDKIHPGTRVRNVDLTITNSARRIKGLFSDEAIAAYEAHMAREKARRQAPGWMIVRAHGEMGPFTAAQLKELAQDQEIDRDTMVRRSDLDRAVPAAKVKGLFPEVAAVVGGKAEPADVETERQAQAAREQAERQAQAAQEAAARAEAERQAQAAQEEAARAQAARQAQEAQQRAAAERAAQEEAEALIQAEEERAAQAARERAAADRVAQEEAARQAQAAQEAAARAEVEVVSRAAHKHEAVERIVEEEAACADPERQAHDVRTEAESELRSVAVYADGDWDVSAHGRLEQATSPEAWATYCAQVYGGGPRQHDGRHGPGGWREWFAPDQDRVYPRDFRRRWWRRCRREDRA